ncbi:MAG: hypothetical protein CMF50_07865 [Legionellales bacterium]|nr:hypothetical protein [Legionellales bacterium]|tara:strand:+ start:2548 stop:3714 length:1167 start_codon:yes stop_codon:yes gene_type:complete
MQQVIDRCNSAKQQYITLPGTVRAEHPETTLAELREKFTQFGITRVANLTGLDNIGIPVYAAIRPNAKSLSVSQGKGTTHTLAKISAIMEAIEIWHAEHLTPPITNGSYAELASEHTLIHPAHLLNPQFVLPTIETQSMAWLEAVEVNSRQISLIPQALVSMDTTQVSTLSLAFATSTNGLASGNTLEEALLHGLYEVIERDCMARWQVGDSQTRSRSQIDISTIDDDGCQDLLASIQRANYGVYVWDVSSQLGIPAFHCRIHDAAFYSGLPIFAGTGCHGNKAVALSRAITEAIQSRVTVISGARDDLPASYGASSGLTGAEYGPKDYRQCDDIALSGSFAGDIREVCQRLTHAGFAQVLYHDCSKAQYAIPVVKVIVPGLAFNRVH